MEGEAGAAEVACCPLAGQVLKAAGLGGGQGDQRDAGRAGLAAGDGKWRVAGVYLQVSAVDGGFFRGGGSIRHGREPGGAGEGRLDGDGPDLGEGGQGGVPVDRGPGPGLGLVPAVRVLPGPERNFSQPPLMPLKQKPSLAFRMHPGRY